MAKELLKGNYAIVKGAILAGCRLYFGYPITPASEIAEAASFYLPPIGGTFIQAESEVAAINMLYGAVGGGIRAMTASSSPGISLKMEGISYAAGAELPHDEAPLTKTEVDKYYREDKLIWVVFLGLRRLDRFFSTRLLWKRYEFILPGKIKR